MNLVQLFQAQVRIRPQAPAIVEWRGGQHRVTSFADLEHASCRAAARLQRHGLRAGDVVLVFLPMSAALYELILAVLRSGMRAMFLDPTVSSADMTASCRRVPPRGFVAVTRAHLLRFRCQALRDIPVKFAVGCPFPGAARWAGNEPPERAVRPCDPETPALITFTSGSTGEPKAVVRSHGFLRAQHRLLERVLVLRPGEVDLATLPIFLLANLASGVTSVIPRANLRFPGSIAARPVLEQMRAFGVTRCAGSPALFERLLSGSGTLPGLRRAYVGGGPVFPRLLEALSHAMPEGTVHAIYGSTEAEPIAELDARCLTPADRAAIGGGQGLLVGHPVPEIDLRICSDSWGQPLPPMTQAQFEDRALPRGSPGEILVNGPHVLTGYLDGHGDEETKVRVAGRVWHRTGDAGWLDEQGRLWLLGRCGARVRDERGTVWPLAVEGAAVDHADVRRAALSLQAGRRVLAIEPHSSAGSRLPRDLTPRLAWAGLDECRLVRRIPVDRRHNAKVDYRALRALLG